MNLKKAKEYFELGVICGFVAHRDPMAKGWMLIVNQLISGGVSGQVLETALGEPKVFASLDTMWRQIEQIAGEVREIKFSTRMTP